MNGLSSLARFVDDLDALLDGHPSEETILRQGSALLAELVGKDDWLPAPHAEPDPVYYRQYLLHLDAEERYSIVSFVWGPGQSTPVHDHRIWGLVGVLRGAERDQRYQRESDGKLRPDGDSVLLEPGDVAAISPENGDIHKVSNAYKDRISISIHVYGADIGKVRRATYDAAGVEKLFVSGYADVLPPVIRP